MPGKSLKGVGDCVYYDLDYVKDVLHGFFYENITPEEYIKLNGVRKNDWYAQAMGQTSTTPTVPETPSTPSTPDDTTTPEDNTSTPSVPDGTTPPEDDTTTDVEN